MGTFQKFFALVYSVSGAYVGESLMPLLEKDKVFFWRQ
jgi:hypothetical protein